MKSILALIMAVAALAGSRAALAADPPSIINHQGRITVGGVNFAGPTGYFKFVLVDGAGTTRYWDNDGTTGGAPAEPGTAVPVAVSAGHYGVGIGDTSLTNMAALDPDIFADNGDVSLRIYFSTAMGGPFELLSPDIVMNSVGFALNARKAQKVADGAVTTDMLADGAVTEPKISSSYWYFNGMENSASMDLSDVLGLTASIDLSFENVFSSVPNFSLSASGGQAISVSQLTTAGYMADVTLAWESDLILAKPSGLDKPPFGSPSTAIINGNPAVAFYDAEAIASGISTDLAVRFAYSSDPDGAPGTWTVVTVDTLDFSPGGQFFPLGSDQVSLALISGKPAIAYRHRKPSTSDATLRYAYSTDVQGVAGTWIALEVDGPAANRTGIGATLREVSGAPAISFGQSGAPAGLKYARSTHSQGASGWSVRVIRANSATEIPVDSSLAVVNGNPAVSYFDDFTDNLCFLRSPSVDGMTGTWTRVVVDGVGDVGRNSSLGIVNGNPAISYRDVTNTDIKYAYSNSATGGAGTWTAVVASPNFSYTTSLAVVAGKPMILYSDVFNLSYVSSSDVQGIGGSWLSPVVIERLHANSSFSDRRADLVIADGAPALAILDNGTVAPGDLEEGMDFVRIPVPKVTWAADGGDTLDLNLANGSVTSAVIAAGAVMADDIGAAAVTANSLADGSVTAAKIGSGAVTQLALAVGAVTSASIVNGTVGIVDIGFNHGDLPGLGDDDHPQYVLADGTRAFTSVVGGVSPVAATDLATKSYVDAPQAQYLRSDTNDSFTAGTLTVNGGAALHVAGSLWIGLDDATDIDAITFDAIAEQETMSWDDPQGRFEFSDDLAISGALQAGSTSSSVAYNRMGTATAAHFLNGASDLLISDDLEVAGTIYVASQLRVGTNVGTDNDQIFFDSGTSEFLEWDDALGDFEFSDNVRGTSFIPTSDRNAKEDFSEVDAAEILEKVAALPITKWKFKESERDEVRHIGPVSQDFHDAFGLGPDEKTITTTDADGVALAAIQALKAESDAKSVRIAELEARLERLEKLMNRATE